MNSIDQLIQDLLTAIEQANQKEDKILQEIMNSLRQNAVARAAFNQKFAAVVGRSANSPTSTSVLHEAERRVREEFETMRRSRH
jgi:hypothetical protein